MARISRLLSRLLAVLVMTLLSHAALADPPGRVGRLADLQGQVWLYDIETAEWVAAARNRPLTSGDRVSTDGGARAELRIGSTTLRLDAGTEVELLQLDDDRVRVQLHNGLLALRLRTHEAARELELVTVEGRFKPDRAGRYRLDRIDATSTITVWSGQLLFEAPDNAVTLVAGQRADIWNDGRTQYTLVQPQRDAFADEVAASELAEERSVSAKYVSPEMTGVEDLDRYGRWETDPEYGALWVPRAVAPGWAPYRFGHWAWIRPWGWTWVDDAPWGFAPFHYGRWVYQRNAWCWAPGRWVARPVYAPALVAWVGAPGLSVSIGIGSAVGWFPLAPREVFVPGYRTSPRYVRNVNVTHVTNISNVTNIINSPNTVVQQTNYMNRSLPGAMTIVPASVVSGRQPVAPARVHLTDPRPGAGPERGIAAASLSTAMAAPQIQAPAPARNMGAAPPRPATSPAAGANPAAGFGRAIVPAPATPNPIVAPAPARGAVPPPPATQPVIRHPRPAFEAAAPAAEGVARPVAPPAPTAPSVATPVRPSPAAPPGARVGVPAAVPPATVPQPAPVDAEPRHRPVPPAAVVTAPQPAPVDVAPRQRPVPPTPVVTAPQPAPADAAPRQRPVPPAPVVTTPQPVPPPSPPRAVQSVPAAPPAQPTAAPVAPKAPPAPTPRGREPRDEPRETGKVEK